MEGRLNDRIIYMRPAEDLMSGPCKGLPPGCIGFMILSCNDSVGPSFRQRGELRDMSVQFAPLNNLQSRVMQGQQALWGHLCRLQRFDRSPLHGGRGLASLP